MYDVRRLNDNKYLYKLTIEVGAEYNKIFGLI